NGALLLRGSLGFSSRVPVRRPFFSLQALPVGIAVRTKGECYLLVECRRAVGKNQRANLRRPPLYQFCLLERLAFLGRLHVEDRNSARTPDKVVVEEREGKRLVGDELVELTICLGCIDSVRSEG